MIRPSDQKCGRCHRKGVVCATKIKARPIALCAKCKAKVEAMRVIP